MLFAQTGPILREPIQKLADVFVRQAVRRAANEDEGIGKGGVTLKELRQSLFPTRT